VSDATLRPRRFAVIGDPIAQSKSPVMQAAAFRALGLPHTYEAIRAPAAEVPAIVARLRDGVFDGINVTVPHKTRVLELVDAVDDWARIAGAANTLVRSADGRLTAYNTDAPALAAELRGLQSRARPARAWAETRALVLGSGGAARAAVVSLAVPLGVRDIVVRARAFGDPKRRDEFVATAPSPVKGEPWAASEESEARTGVLVQATSAGMRGADDGETAARAVAWDALPDDAVAIDVVYAPRETPWLRAARARALRCDDGLGMLARQGALALELWLGVEAPLAEMRAAIE
jgi:shikimate dehydrogenase